jgi:hypothetical protein
MLCLSYYAYVLLQQNQSEGQNRTCLKWRRGGGQGGEMTQTMYAHNKKFLKISIIRKTKHFC